MRLRFIIGSFLFFLISLANAEIIKIEYEGFEVWLDCDRRGDVRFEYESDEDDGNLNRKSSSTFDNDIEDGCQQTSTSTYSPAPQSYDRGHLVPANHLDHDRIAIVQSNNMTNVLPQARNMNRRSWLLTEEIIECVRDETPVHVIGGVFWGHNPHDDFFLESHGVETPDYFWKIIIRDDKNDKWQ